MRAEKKEKKHFEKQKKAMGLGGGTSMVKPKEPPKPVRDALLLLYSIKAIIFCRQCDWTYQEI